MSQDDTSIQQPVDANDPPEAQPQGDNLKQLREAAAKGTRLEKENVFLRAGLDTTDKMVQRMFAAYAGEMTVEAIKAEAEDWGIAEPAPGQEPPDPNAGQADFRQAAAGAPPPGASPPPPAEPVMTEAWKSFHNPENKNQPLETRQLTVIDKMIEAASNGDKSVLFDEEAWLAERAQAGYDFKR